MNRKVFLFRITLFFASFFIVYLGCNAYRKHASVKEENTLHVYTWSDYIAPDIIQEFEHRNNCTVCIDTFDDNESMLAKMQAGATGYDVIFPSSYVIPVLRKQGMIQHLDMEKLPNVTTNFDYKFKDSLHEDSFKYSVPYAFSMTGIAFRNDKVQLDEKEQQGMFSWGFLAKPSLVGKTCIMNDIREIIGVGLKINGCSNNSLAEGEILKSVDSVAGMKKCARRLDSVEYRIGLVNGSFYAAMVYSSDVFQVLQENPNIPITFVIPMEGGNSSWDEMCITATSAKVDLAHKFIDFIYEAEIAAKNIEYVGSAMPNVAVAPLLDDEIKSSPLINVPQNILDRLELIQDVGTAIQYYNKAWDLFMAIH